MIKDLYIIKKIGNVMYKKAVFLRNNNSLVNHLVLIFRQLKIQN